MVRVPRQARRGVPGSDTAGSRPSEPGPRQGPEGGAAVAASAEAGRLGDHAAVRLRRHCGRWPDRRPEDTAVFRRPGSAEGTGGAAGPGGYGPAAGSPDGPGGSGAYGRPQPRSAEAAWGLRDGGGPGHGAYGSADGPGGSGATGRPRTGPAAAARTGAPADGPGGTGAYRAADGPGGSGAYRPRVRPGRSPRLRRGARVRPGGVGPARPAAVRAARLRPAGPAPGYGQQPPGYGPAYAQQGPRGYGPQAYGPGYGPPGFHTAPRPGIIPLRPLGFGDFFGGAFGYIRANPVVHTGARAGRGRRRAGRAVRGAGRAGRHRQSAELDRRPPALRRDARSARPGSWSLLGLVLGAVLTAILFTVLRGAVIGRRTDLGAAWRAALPKVPGLIGVVGASSACSSRSSRSSGSGWRSGSGSGSAGRGRHRGGRDRHRRARPADLRVGAAVASRPPPTSWRTSACSRRSPARATSCAAPGCRSSASLLVATLAISVVGGVIGAVAGVAGGGNVGSGQAGAAPGIGFYIADRSRSR